MLTISFVKDRPNQVNKIGSRHRNMYGELESWRLEQYWTLTSHMTNTCTIVPSLYEYLNSLEHLFDDR